MTPVTGKGASFEKYGGAYTWPVVNRKPFDIENQTFHIVSALAVMSIGVEVIDDNVNGLVI